MKINIGVHTYSVSMMLTANQYHTIKRNVPELELKKIDYFNSKEFLYSGFRENQGIKIYLSHFGLLYQLRIQIEPCRVLGSNNPTDLYISNKKAYRKLVKITDEILKNCKVPRSIDKMKICRIDLTNDLYFDDHEMLMQYLRILKKGMILPHYKLKRFNEKEKKAKDPVSANKHAYRQQCKSAIFTAYDKTAQLDMIGRADNILMGKYILRLETALKRNTMQKHLGKQSDNYHFLKTGAEKSQKVIIWYLKRIFKGCTGSHVCYQDAVDKVNATLWKEKTKKRLCYFLRKVSDSQSLNAAIDKTCERFRLSSSQMSRLMKKLDQLDIHPITLPNNCKFEYLKELKQHKN